MQTIGLIGGMSWESSAVYYSALNKGVQERVGGLASARTVMASLDFAELTALQEAERWDEVATLLTAAAVGVERAGADFLLLCTTTFHEVADQVSAAVGIPLLHLGDVVADAVRGAGLDKVGYLGTAYTMAHPTFAEKVSSRGLDVLLPDEIHHETLDRVIYDELVRGRVVAGSRRRIVHMIEELWDAGAEGVILGCTELELLVKQPDSEIPLFPVTTLHVAAALDRALS